MRRKDQQRSKKDARRRLHEVHAHWRRMRRSRSLGGGRRYFFFIGDEPVPAFCQTEMLKVYGSNGLLPRLDQIAARR